MQKMKIYGKPNCSWCEKAKKLLSNYGIDFDYIDVSNGDNLRELKNLFPEVKTVPQVFDFDGSHIGSYEDLARKIIE